MSRRLLRRPTLTATLPVSGCSSFLIDVDEVDLREEAIQAQLFDSDVRDATVVVVADVHSLAFTRAATSLAEAIGGALADLERALPGAVVVFITIEQAIDHALGLTAGS